MSLFGDCLGARGDMRGLGFDSFGEFGAHVISQVFSVTDDVVEAAQNADFRIFEWVVGRN